MTFSCVLACLASTQKQTAAVGLGPVSPASLSPCTSQGASCPSHQLGYSSGLTGTGRACAPQPSIPVLQSPFAAGKFSGDQPPTTNHQSINAHRPAPPPPAAHPPCGTVAFFPAVHLDSFAHNFRHSAFKLHWQR